MNILMKFKIEVSRHYSLRYEGVNIGPKWLSSSSRSVDALPCAYAYSRWAVGGGRTFLAACFFHLRSCAKSCASQAISSSR